ncbi:MAG: pyridoxal-5'-phosphate-dependent protein subunit beta [Deltaproteobacteria bacterium HGW-Deltaproteobacteria-14]|jgi:cystathionine beta-synthase|nr:MAG: pyridoxal-5'-phosphate-dependent protein subunit beta [Deltaproteobacteria bacterium HGW-Deltaproteobacteria-14]
MMKGAFANVVEAVGRTPIVRLNKLASHVAADLYCKLEYLNPGGSVKDRPAIQMVDDFEAEGRLRPGGTIVEATSGNTGMGLAMVAAVRGYKTVFVMPDKMSEEKIAALRAFGSRVVVCPTDVEPDDPRSYYVVARRLAEETPGAVLANQYHNASNPRAHYLTTGPEIWEQTGGEIDVLVTSMGTGGTISGVAQYLKERKPSLRIIGVDPVGSIYYDYFRTGKITQAHSYRVEGFGEDFLPGTMDFQWVDEVIRVSDKDCFQWTRRVVREEGLYTGGSGGGTVCAAVRYAERAKKKENILCILPDSAVRYLSKIFNDTWMREGGYLEPELGEDTVADILAATPRELVAAAPSDTFGSVIGRMKEFGISQLPVLQDGRMLGLISEVATLKALLEGRAQATTPIADFVSNDFAMVEAHNRVSLLSTIFHKSKIVVVEDGGRVAGIVTQIDLIDWVSSRINA